MENKAITIKNILNGVEFKKLYDNYVKNNSDILSKYNFLENLDINKNYYKLKIFNNIDELKIKNINGYLNRLTSQNLKEICILIDKDIKHDEKLLDPTINLLFDKCILQKTYILNYISIFKFLIKTHNSRSIIYKYINIYSKIFTNQEITPNKNVKNYTTNYLELCEKNKKVDNYIGYCETIYQLELNNIINNKSDTMIYNILSEIIKLPESDKSDEIYKYICCLYNIYKTNKNCPLDIKNKLKEIKLNLKSKKIIFKIMDILEL